MASLPDSSIDHMPVVRDLADFPRASGNMLERAVFNHRRSMLAACLLVTLVLAAFTLRVGLNASYFKMLPVSHPYIQNYLENKNDLRGMGNSLRVVVESAQGDVFDPRYLDALKRINDELFLAPGVERAWVKSLWMPAVRWTEVTEEGFQGGPVMPDNFDGSPDSVARLRMNAARAGLIGSLVANDFKSSAIVLPLLEKTSDGKPLDYRVLSRTIEDLRNKYEHGTAPDGKPWGVKVRVIGFAKIAGDLLDGLAQVAMYFGIAAAIAALLL